MDDGLLRSFFAIAELGSLSRAAERLRVAQSTLTRQVQALEREVGGRLFERGATGVALTAAGQTLFDGMKPVLARADAVMADVRKRARGQTSSLRVGYLVSAAREYLNPALARLRKAHPEIKVKLVDLSPGEQLVALRDGALDVAMIGNAEPSVAREFFVKRIASVPVMVAMPENHALAHLDSIALAELRREVFVGAHDKDLPGYNRWIVQLCRRAGFRPRFIDNSDSLAHALSMLVTENAVTLLPAFAARSDVPQVAFRSLRQPKAQWDLAVAWQRGKISDPVRQLLAALSNPATP